MPKEAEWVDFQNGVFSRPECEVVGWDNYHLYAFRSPYAGSTLPGKARDLAFICHGDQQVQMTTGQLLKKGMYEWVFGKDGNVPPNAVVAGNDPYGNPYYLGRAFLNGTLSVGSVEPKRQCLCIAYGGVVHRFTSYTVLCYKDVECLKPPPQQPCPVSTCPKSSGGGDYGYGN